MLSIMCSTADSRLARIGEAIDEVAATAVDAGGSPSLATVTSRLAGIWAMVAELDPGLAATLNGYAPDPDGPAPRSASDGGTGPANAQCGAASGDGGPTPTGPADARCGAGSGDGGPSAPGREAWPDDARRD